MRSKRPRKPLAPQAKKPRKKSFNVALELLELARQSTADMTEADWAKVPSDLSSSYKRRKRLVRQRKAAS